MTIKLTVGGKEMPFSLGLGFLGDLIDESGSSIEDVLLGVSNNPYKYIPLAMYVSARYASEREGREFEYTKHAFYDLIDDDGGLTDANKSAVKFMQSLTKSLVKDVPEEKPSKNEGKPKK